MMEELIPQFFGREVAVYTTGDSGTVVYGIPREVSHGALLLEEPGARDHLDSLRDRARRAAQGPAPEWCPDGDLRPHAG